MKSEGRDKKILVNPDGLLTISSRKVNITFAFIFILKKKKVSEVKTNLLVTQSMLHAVISCVIVFFFLQVSNTR